MQTALVTNSALAAPPPMPKSYYMQLKPIVLNYLTHYHEDFLKHDRQSLRGFTGTFIFAMRETGTNLLRFGGDTRANARFDEVMEHFMFRANRRFFIGEHGAIREVTEEQARCFYETAKDRGETFMESGRVSIF